MDVILRGTYNVEQVEEQLRRRFPVPILGLELKDLHLSSRFLMNLGGDNFQILQYSHLKLIKRNLHPYLGEHALETKLNTRQQGYKSFFGIHRKE